MIITIQCISILGYIYQGAAFHAKQISKAVIRTSSERTVRITAITMHLGSSPPGFESAWFYFFGIAGCSWGIYTTQLQAPGNKEQSELAFIVVGVRVLTASKRGFDSNFLLSFLLAFLYFFISFLCFWGIYTTQTAGA